MQARDDRGKRAISAGLASEILNSWALAARAASEHFNQSKGKKRSGRFIPRTGWQVEPASGMDTGAVHRMVQRDRDNLRCRCLSIGAGRPLVESRSAASCGAGCLIGPIESMSHHRRLRKAFGALPVSRLKNRVK